MSTFNLKEHLRKLGTGEVEPTAANAGLCKELRTLRDSGLITQWQRQSVINLINHWPSRSGDPLYPVKCSWIPDSADAYFRLSDKWGNTLYGSKRREMCAWLAENYEEEP